MVGFVRFHEIDDVRDSGVEKRFDLRGPLVEIFGAGKRPGQQRAGDSPVRPGEGKGGRGKDLVFVDHHQKPGRMVGWSPFQIERHGLQGAAKRLEARGLRPTHPTDHNRAP